MRKLSTSFLRIMQLFIACTVGLAVTYASAQKPATTSPTPVGTAKYVPLVGEAADATVASCVKVTPLLIPPPVAQHVFGREISRNYAIVQVTISNHCQDRSFILQDLFLDESHWLFSNNFQIQGPPSPGKDQLTEFESASKPWQVSSAEARVVRSELQDSAVWSRRNFVVRGLTLIGTLATGYSFLATDLTPDTNFLKGINAFTGEVIPGVSTFWPDRTVDQINRVSDFGFKTNHAIGKGSSDIVIGFFPLDTFLTPSFKDIFIKSPAEFIVPGQMLMEPKDGDRLVKLMKNGGFLQNANTSEITAAFAEYEGLRSQNKNAAEIADTLSPKNKLILSALQKASLSNIRVVVGGIVSVDVNSIPATLDSVTFTDDTKAATWATGNKVKGVLKGSFLSDGSLTITNSDGSSAGTVAVDQDNSSDTQLSFTLTLASTETTDNKLIFTVTKIAQDRTTNSSKPFSYTIPPPSN